MSSQSSPKILSSVRGKKIDRIIEIINTKPVIKVTLGGCLIKKVNKTVIVTKEH